MFAEPEELVSVKEYMSAPVVALAPHTTAADAIDLIVMTGHNGFPVVVDNEVVGVVTSADLIRAKQFETIADVMTPDPLTAEPDDDLVSIAGVMAFNHIHHLPIIEGRRLVGIVTSTDMLRASVENIISENIERIFTFFQSLHPDARIGHTRVEVASLIPTQKLLDPAELQLRDEQFKHGVIYPIVVAVKGSRTYIIDGHHRAYLANKLKIEEIPAFYIEGDLGIVKTATRLGLRSLDDMTLIPNK
ncbi:MAG: CBS domain-containing protein [Euryarchaeota archaeon]|nr:CBS domain-containing protein [Euryarchaeota archaeon]